MPENNNNNVVAFPGASLRDIPLASTHSPGVPLPGSRNEVWLCPAYSGSYERMLYVKPRLNVRQIVAELVCAQVAIAMGLPSPTPHLVVVKPEHVGRPRGHSSLAFGSQQMGARSTGRIIRDLDVLFEALQKAKAMEGLCVLDEWVANEVRHERDVIFHPAGQVWIIDHESAVPAGTQPDAYVTNWLADRLRERTEPNKRTDLLRLLRQRAERVRQLRHTGAPVELQRIEGATETWQAVSEFLQQRLEHLGRLLQQRVSPEQGILSIEPPQSEHRESH